MTVIKSDSLNEFFEQTLANKRITDLEKSTILKNLFDAEKAIADAEKAKADTENAKRPQPKEAQKLFISSVAPLLTAFALLATLWFQINQTQINNKNQLQSEEDAAWRDMLKQLNSSVVANDFTLPTLIRSFYGSQKYSRQAREISIIFLSRIVDNYYFKTILDEFATPADWKNISSFVTLSSILKTKYYKTIYYKNPLDSTTNSDIKRELFFVGRQIIELLKIENSTRPDSIDLGGVFFDAQNLDNVNFSGAIISGTTFENCSVKNTDFSEILEYRNPYIHSVWGNTAWWRTNKIQQELKYYLKEEYPKDSSVNYWQALDDKTDYKIQDSIAYLKLIDSR